MKSFDMKPIRVVTAAGAVLMLTVAATALAQGDALSRARSQVQATDAAGRSSQQRVDNIDDKTQQALQRYRAALFQTQQLQAYATQVQPLLEQQQQELASLQQQLKDQGDVQQQMLPLMLQMVDSLARFVSMDLPFLQQERQERIANLKRAMADASMPLAEKFQRVAEAYRVEADYGRKLGAEQEDIVVGGQHKNVDVLRVGRVALLYISPDDDDSGYWNAQQKRWVSLGGAHARDIRDGLKIARGDVAATPLPLPLPTAAVGASQ